MISERDIAEKFNVIWKQHFPLMTPSFMRVFNESHMKCNTSEVIISDTSRHDLISELAFNIASETFHSGNSIDNFVSDNTRMMDAIKKTTNLIWKSTADETFSLTETEIVEVLHLSRNITEFVKIQHAKHILFKPQIKGYGIISGVTADVEVDDTIVEIKTVNRNFRTIDLRQLFIYIALQQSTGDMKWKYGCLYNPRKGICCRFNIKNLVYNLSGGRSNDVFIDILDNLTRDIQIDTKF